MSKAIYLTSLVLLVTALRCAPLVAESPVRVADLPVHEFFSDTDSPGAVLRGIARTALYRGLLGFEELTSEGPNVTVSGRETTVGAMLTDFCKQEPRYHVVEAGDPRVINLLIVDEKAPSKRILEFRIPQLDIETDDSPDQIVRHLMDFVPDFYPYLYRVYQAEGGQTSTAGAGGSLMASETSPHFSLHLKNVSVREALNRIALRSLEMYHTIGLNPEVISTAHEQRIFPTGWQLHFGNPRETSFLLWSNSLFIPLR